LPTGCRGVAGFLLLQIGVSQIMIRKADKPNRLVGLFEPTVWPANTSLRLIDRAETRPLEVRPHRHSGAGLRCPTTAGTGHEG